MKLKDQEISFKCANGHTVTRRFKACPTRVLSDGRMAVADPDLGRPCGAEQVDVIISSDAFNRIVEQMSSVGIPVDMAPSLNEPFQLGTKVIVRDDCTNGEYEDEPSRWCGWYGEITGLHPYTGADPNITVTMDGTGDVASFFPHELDLYKQMKAPQSWNVETSSSGTISTGGLFASNITNHVSAPMPSDGSS